MIMVFFSSSFFFQLMKIALLDNGSFLNINVRLCFVVVFFFSNKVINDGIKYDLRPMMY